MSRAIRAELVKLRRPSVLIGAGAVLPVLAIVGTVTMFAAAKATTKPPTGPNDTFAPSLGQLGAAGGMTRGFTVSVALVGILIMMVFIVSTTNEWGQGTIRMMFTRDPRRLRVTAGKAVALLIVTAAALLLALLASILAAYVMAGARDVSTGSWLSGAGLRRAGGDWLRAVLSASCFGLFGMALGILIRSTSVAVPVAFAWFFPLEHIIANAWAGAERWFPGLLLDAIARDGTSQTGFARALGLGLAAVAVLVTAAAVDLRRRDISA